MTRVQGTIVRILKDKGFGFIGYEGVEHFFHRSAVQNGDRFELLLEGQLVTFVVGESSKGPRAERVRCYREGAEKGEEAATAGK